jgi:hypothetical protein
MVGVLSTISDGKELETLITEEISIQQVLGRIPIITLLCIIVYAQHEALLTIAFTEKL